jgi:hypothetical protein
MLNFNPQQQPGMFPVIDELENRVHPVVRYVLGACCAIGGYVYGCTQDAVPVALCMALGLVVGLLLVPLLLKTASFIVAALIVGAAALLTFWLLTHDAELKHAPKPTPMHEIRPDREQSGIDRLFPAVHP